MTEGTDTYYARATRWADDRQASLRNSQRVAWIVAGVATGVAVVEALALFALAPLKTVVPYTLLVDRNTGYVQAIEGDKDGKIQADEALTQSLLAQYVIAREGFEISGVKGNYRKVALWSADSARRDYLALMPASNPQSPLNRLPRTSTVNVTVRSVSLTDPGVAMVRFETRRIDQGQQAGGPVAAYVAVIRYRYSGAPMAIEDRLINPLGFQVVKYRRDQEAVSAEVEAQAEALAPAPAATRAPAVASPAASVLSQTAPGSPVPSTGPGSTKGPGSGS